MVVRVQDIYDELNDGIVSPWAIRDLLAHAVSTWALAPRWVVLAGDGSFDYVDHWGTGDNLLPAPMVSTAYGFVPSDNSLADLAGNDGVPELAIGRLPVHSPAELEAYVAKLTAFTGGDKGHWRQQTVWLADDADDSGDFADDSETLISLLGSTYSADRIYLDRFVLTAARAILRARLRQGALLVNYLGHGGLDRLADSGLLTSSDVSGMGNQRTPIITALSCSVGRFDLPGYDTLAEALVLEPDGGAVALWSASGLMQNAAGTALGAELIRSAMDGEPHYLGDAVVTALQAYAGTAGADPMIPSIYTLLGDPAVPLSSD
jgi:hypothetical protein